MIMDALLEPVSKRCPALLFSIPAADARFFASQIPHDHQVEIRERLRMMAQIHLAKNKLSCCKQLAAAAQAQRKSGRSATRLYHLYYSFIKSGDWRVLWNKAKAPARRQGVPKEFIELMWLRLTGNHQKKCSSAYSELLDIWRTHYNWAKELVKEIPGYSTWPEADPMTGIPAGWSYSNLMGFLPDDYELAAERIGRSAAATFRLKTYTTRVGLRLCEFIQFDDHEFNLKVNFEGQVKAMRPRGFTAVDVLSAAPFAKSFKPTLWDQEEEVKKTLTERDMMWFVIHVLCDFGYRTDERGTALCVEWGTAAIREAFEKRIVEACGGNVRVERSGKFGDPAHKGQFNGAVKGNFRFKALVESFFSIIDTFIAHARGQVGMNRLTAPEQMAGAESYNNRLLKAALTLSEADKHLIKYPFCSWHEFLEVACEAYQRIEENTDHKLEGWERLKFITTDWRLNEAMPFMSQQKLLELPEAERAVALALVDSNPDLLRRARRFSRGEVFAAHRKELTPLPHFLYPTLIGPENCLRNNKNDDTLTVRSGVFEFEDKDIEPGHVFRFTAMDDYGQRLPNGEAYVCFMNPFSPSHLVACDAKLKVVAVCQATAMPCRNDVHGVEAAMGAAKHWEAQALNRIATRHMPEIAAKAEMHRANGELLHGETLAEATRRQESIDRVDVVKEQLKKDLPVTPITEDWV